MFDNNAEMAVVISSFNFLGSGIVTDAMLGSTLTVSSNGIFDIRGLLVNDKALLDSKIGMDWIQMCDLEDFKVSRPYPVGQFINIIQQSAQWRHEVETMWQTMNCETLVTILS